jgi:hypothetical protein
LIWAAAVTNRSNSPLTDNVLANTMYLSIYHPKVLSFNKNAISPCV